VGFKRMRAEQEAQRVQNKKIRDMAVALGSVNALTTTPTTAVAAVDAGASAATPQPSAVSDAAPLTAAPSISSALLAAALGDGLDTTSTVPTSSANHVIPGATSRATTTPVDNHTTPKPPEEPSPIPPPPPPPSPHFGDASLHLMLPYGMIPPPISPPAPPNPFYKSEKMQKLTISCRGTFITYDYLGGDYEEACEDLFLDLADCLASEDPVVRSLGFSEAKENFGSAIWQARRDPVEGVERKRAEEVERLQLENHKLKQVAQQRQQQVEILKRSKAALDDVTKLVKEDRDNPR
jgi:hypothetical protein